MEKSGLKVNGQRGTWYVIDESHAGVYNLIGFDGRIYLLENENHGDEWPCLIVDSKLNVIMQDVYNGFEELS